MASVHQAVASKLSRHADVQPRLNLRLGFGTSTNNPEGTWQDTAKIRAGHSVSVSLWVLTARSVARECSAAFRKYSAHVFTPARRWEWSATADTV